MRVARAVALSPLLPLLGVGLVGIEMGIRSVADLTIFVAMWAIFIYPLVAALALVGYFGGRRLGLLRLWHFATSGLLAGSILCTVWLGPPLLAAATSVGVVVGGIIVGGIIGAGSAVIFWRQAVR